MRTRNADSAYTPMPRPTPRNTPNRSFDALLHSCTAKSPLIAMGHPQNYPFPQTDPKTQLPALSLDPSALLSQTASISV